MFKKYLLNFWIWWYGAKLRDIFVSVYSFWSLSLANLNILPMLSNLFVPMYQDQTFIGKILSFFLRLGWIFAGLVLQFLITFPLIAIVLVWILLPATVHVQMVRSII